MLIGGTQELLTLPVNPWKQVRLDLIFGRQAYMDSRTKSELAEQTEVD
jgi:hypothetical protein